MVASWCFVSYLLFCCLGDPGLSVELVGICLEVCPDPWNTGCPFSVLSVGLGRCMDGWSDLLGWGLLLVGYFWMGISISLKVGTVYLSIVLWVAFWCFISIWLLWSPLGCPFLLCTMVQTSTGLVLVDFMVLFGWMGCNWMVYCGLSLFSFLWLLSYTWQFVLCIFCHCAVHFLKNN